MRSSSEFKSVTRRGARASSRSLVVHARRNLGEQPLPTSAETSTDQSPPSRVGFVVSKAVGNAVTRNRVKRRLRHLVIPLLEQTPPVLVVVRANSAAAVISNEQLRLDLESAWQRTMRRVFTAGEPGRPTADAAPQHTTPSTQE